MRIATAEKRAEMRRATDGDSEKARGQQNQKDRQDEARAAYVSRPDVPPRIGKAILNHQIILVCTAEELKVSLENHRHTTRSVAVTACSKSGPTQSVVDLPTAK